MLLLVPTAQAKTRIALVLSEAFQTLAAFKRFIALATLVHLP